MMTGQVRYSTYLIACLCMMHPLGCDRKECLCRGSSLSAFRLPRVTNFPFHVQGEGGHMTVSLVEGDTIR